MKEVFTKERESLENQLQELRLKERRYEESLRFIFNDELIEVLINIINIYEKKVYVLGNFNLKEEDRHEIKYSSPEPDPSGCSSWGNNEISSYKQWIPGEFINLYVILDQKSYNTFKLFTFSKCIDLKNNLFNFLKDKKYAYLKENITVEDFKDFPYIINFLKLLSMWRYENNSLEIPKDTLNKIYKKFINENKSSRLVRKLQ